VFQTGGTPFIGCEPSAATALPRRRAMWYSPGASSGITLSVSHPNRPE
jgi:hypothetical protein